MMLRASRLGKRDLAQRMLVEVRIVLLARQIKLEILRVLYLSRPQMMLSEQLQESPSKQLQPPRRQDRVVAQMVILNLR
jgi:hypothetical protein